MLDKWCFVNILIAHWVGDFVCQTRHMADNKSKDIKVLLKHLGILHFWLGIVVLVHDWHMLWLLIPNAIIHGLIDWNLWKPYKARVPKNHEYWKDHDFWTILGLDQCIHMVTYAVLFL